MAIILNDNLDIKAPKPIDERFGSYPDITTALASVPENFRYKGLTIGIDNAGNIQEYWFESGTSDGDLVRKVGEASDIDLVLEAGSTITADRTIETGGNKFGINDSLSNSHINKEANGQISLQSQATIDIKGIIKSNIIGSQLNDRTISETVFSNPNGVAITGNKAYVVDDDDDIVRVFDLSSPANPLRLSNEDFGSGIIDEPVGIQVRGSKAYILSQSTDKVDVFDISTSSAVYLTNESITTVGFFNGFYVDEVNSKVYIADTQINGVQVWDISIPASPVQLNDETISNTGTFAGDVHVDSVNNKLYLLDRSADVVFVWDISTPSLPVALSSEDIGAGIINLGRQIQLVGNKLYVLDDNANEILVFDLSTPTSPTQITNETISVPNNSTPNFKIVGDKIYLANQSLDIVQVFDISTPTSPIELTDETLGDVPILNGLDIFTYGNKMYVADFASNSVKVFDISNPAEPIELESEEVFVADLQPRAVFVKEGKLYVGNRGVNDDIRVFDITTPNSPSELVNESMGAGLFTNCQDILIIGEKLYGLVSNTRTVHVFDISTPSNPVRLIDQEFTIAPVGSDTARGITFLNNRFYVALSGRDEVVVVDVSTPTAPTELPSETIGTGVFNNPFTLLSKDNKLYVGDGSNRILHVYDVSTPSIPVRLESEEVAIGVLPTYSTFYGESIYFMTSDGIFNFSLTNDALSLGSKARYVNLPAITDESDLIHKKYLDDSLSQIPKGIDDVLSQNQLIVGDKTISGNGNIVWYIPESNFHVDSTADSPTGIGGTISFETNDPNNETFASITIDPDEGIDLKTVPTTEGTGLSLSQIAIQPSRLLIRNSTDGDLDLSNVGEGSINISTLLEETLINIDASVGSLNLIGGETSISSVTGTLGLEAGSPSLTAGGTILLDSKNSADATQYRIEINGSRGIEITDNSVNNDGAKYVNIPNNPGDNTLVWKSYVDERLFGAGDGLTEDSGNLNFGGVFENDISLFGLDDRNMTMGTGGSINFQAINIGDISLNQFGSGDLTIQNSGSTGNTAIEHNATGEFVIQNNNGSRFQIQYNATDGASFDIQNNGGQQFNITNNVGAFTILNNGPGGFSIDSNTGSTRLQSTGDNLTLIGNRLSDPGGTNGGQIDFFTKPNRALSGQNPDPVLRGFISPAGSWNFEGNELKNLSDPTDPQDAATKSYVDSNLGGGGLGAGSGLSENSGNLDLGGIIDSNADSEISENFRRTLFGISNSGIESGLIVSNNSSGSIGNVSLTSLKGGSGIGSNPKSILFNYETDQSSFQITYSISGEGFRSLFEDFFTPSNNKDMEVNITPDGLAYRSDYSIRWIGPNESRFLVDKGYSDSHINGKTTTVLDALNANNGPGLAQDGQALVWSNSQGQYILSSVGGGSGGPGGTISSPTTLNSTNGSEYNINIVNGAQNSNTRFRDSNISLTVNNEDTNLTGQISLSQNGLNINLADDDNGEDLSINLNSQNFEVDSSDGSKIELINGGDISLQASSGALNLISNNGFFVTGGPSTISNVNPGTGVTNELTVAGSDDVTNRLFRTFFTGDTTLGVFISAAPDGGSIGYEDSSGINGLTFDFDKAVIRASAGINLREIALDGNFTSIRVTDEAGNIGMTYTGNYDALGTQDDNWIPSYRAVKDYVAANTGGPRTASVVLNNAQINGGLLGTIEIIPDSLIASNEYITDVTVITDVDIVAGYNESDIGFRLHYNGFLNEVINQNIFPNQFEAPNSVFTGTALRKQGFSWEDELSPAGRGLSVTPRGNYTGGGLGNSATIRVVYQTATF